MTSFEKEDLLTLDEVADLLSVTYRHAWQLVNDGDIPHVKVGKRKRVLRSTLNEYVMGAK